MYYKHFNLSGPPFQFTPSAATVYPSKSHQEALAALEWGLLHEPSGLTVLIGEPGTGKTTLISSILARNLAHARVAYIGNPKFSFDEILQIVARQFGIAFRSPQRLARLDALDEFLEAHSRTDRVTVIIDEAQVLPDQVIDELRLLSNCNPGRQTALRFVFVGQPEFLLRLESPGLRQLNERIGARSILNPLEPGEIYEYIDFRLRARSGKAKDIFASSALKHIAEHSGGIPRRINVLCHNAMLLAYTSDSSRVRPQHAKAAAAEYENFFSAARPPEQPNRNSARESNRRWQIAAVATALGAAAIGTGYLWSGISSHSHDFKESSHAVVENIRPAKALDVAAPHARASSPSTPVAPLPLSAFAGLPAPAVDSGTRVVAHEVAAIGHRLREIRVRAGDTVGGIARRYTGSEEKLAELIAANPQLADINRIYPGDVIYLPDIDSSHPAER